VCNYIICFFKSEFFQGVLSSILASIFYVFIIEQSVKLIKKQYLNRNLKKIIGFNISKENKLKLILPELHTRKDIIDSNAFEPNYPFKDISGNNICSSGITSKNDFIAAKFIQDSISNLISESSIIETDSDVYPNTNISYLSFGGTNFYTLDVFKSEDYKLYDVVISGAIRNKQSGKIFSSNELFDFCVICKYVVKNSNTIKILVFGLGETGTTAAGYYFAKNWRSISDRFNKNQFGILLKVKHGIVDSVEEIESIIL
jgi:hypothetical protein